ncbi:MAG TPA: coproporphyrinogen dehydrogenase HemZ, partial [Candidatus Mediterraneibacter cottocaccae]|nr:coproporphyrinogen dehydrogenase HemZ [Candidatus Mediterraneibacter cottocaccae]
MIEIASKKNKFTYNVYHIVKAFFPEEEITQKVDEGQEALVTLKLADGTVFSVTPGEVWGPGSEQADHDPLQVEKWEVTRRVYRHLSEQTGRKLAWGMLTGVRPTKMAMQKIEEGQDREEIVRSFMEDDFVSREKAEL